MGRTNFFFLLIALLIFLIAIPLADDLNLGSAPLVRGLVFSCLLVIGVWSLKGGGRFFTVGMAFVIAGVLLNVLAINMHAPFLQYGSILLLIGFLLVAILFTIQQVAIGTDINTNRIVGAICIYLLLGVIWAMTYTLVDLVSPGSFAGFSPTTEQGWDSEWLYFSFVTMTTLGYGDILPVSATSRGLAYMQAVVGQFYIAVLVAGLVGAYVSAKRES
ncbi:MAG: ion channel [Gammaproteobacteria bacterium]|nr:ion channel [Gammaproteobacteria bacterium]MDH3805055.1 ion channel [Gammaproteobacteria bacterium]